MNVLVADDDADIRDLTAQVFRLRGWGVTTVASGLEALAALDGEEFDIAVLDQHMPPGSGLEVAAERRKLGDGVPIVLWTGWAGSFDEEEARNLHVHVLNKAAVGKLTALMTALVPGPAAS